MQDDLHLAGMAQRTIHGYLPSVRQLADFCQISPDNITEDQLRQWLLHLKIEKQFAYGSLRVAFSGIKFFYTRTCRRNWRTLAETKLQNIKSLPEVITRQQVQQIIDACSTQRMATFFWTGAPQEGWTVVKLLITVYILENLRCLNDVFIRWNTNLKPSS